MAAAKTKYVRPLGDKIRNYRRLRDMTQKELGEKCGLNESTIRNYELGNRYPDEASLQAIAKALNIDVYTLSDPNPGDVSSAIHLLFDLEDQYNISPATDGDHVYLIQKDFQTNMEETEEQKSRLLLFRKGLQAWAHVREELESGKITKEEYEDWKSRYPSMVNTGTDSNLNSSTSNEMIKCREDDPIDPGKGPKRPRKQKRKQ